MKADALRILAEAELASGQSDDARLHAQEALELVPEGSFGTPSRALALRTIGDIELQQGHPILALPFHTRARILALKIVAHQSPLFAANHLGLSRTHTALNHLPKALHHIQTAIHLQTTMAMGENHTLTPHYAQLGRIHLALQQPHQALAAFQHALTLFDPNILHPDRRIEIDEGITQANAALRAERITIAKRGYLDESHVGPMPAATL